MNKNKIVTIDNFLKNARGSALVERLTNEDFGVNPKLTSSSEYYRSGKNFTDSPNKDLAAVNLYLKAYCNLALGMNYFEHLIPNVGHLTPIGDYEEPAAGNSPEERNYQETIKGKSEA